MTDAQPSSPQSTRPAPEKIVVPRKHGEVLIEPRLSELVRAARQPVAFDGKILLGRQMTELRKTARDQLTKSLQEWAKSIGQNPPAVNGPLVFSGHQLDFYHAGVWAKVIAADEVARRSGGTAIDLLVDHDTVDQRGFDIPFEQDGTWKKEPVDYAAASHIPADGLPSPSPEEFANWDAAIARFPLAHTDALAQFLTTLGKLDQQPPHAVWLSRARTDFELSMGLAVAHVPASFICAGEAWQHFLHAWVQNADAWTAVYNRQLAAYRAEHGIHNPQQPMPDLQRNDQQIELPFWAYRLGESRRRVFKRKDASSDVLFADNEKISPEFHIRPRALTLTMFVRLFLADIFIHGIGGALYDQITDKIMAELFALTPPYGCVSAAWLLPLGQAAEDTADLSHLRWVFHHLTHNPQQAIDPFTAVKTDVAERITERRTLIQQIAASLQNHRKDATAKKERQTWFDRLHAVNAELHARCPTILNKLHKEMTTLLAAQQQNKVLLWREYFFPLHTRQSLESLIQKIRQSP